MCNPIVPDLVGGWTDFEDETPKPLYLRLPGDATGVRWTNGTVECRDHIEHPSYLGALGGLDLAGDDGAGILLYGEISCDACLDIDDRGATIRNSNGRTLWVGRRQIEQYRRTPAKEA